MSYGVVYRITCLATGKCYHGQTVDPKTRWPAHFRTGSHCHALCSAIAKYGRESFVFEVVAIASCPDELNSLERGFVQTSLSPIGYNLREGGASGRHSAEARAKMSAAQKIAQNLPEVKAKNSLGVKAAMARPEVKERHRAALKARYSDPKERERQSIMMKEVHSRPGESERRSRSLRESWESYSPEERSKRIDNLKRAYTPELRRQISQQVRETWADPVLRETHSKKMRAAWTPARRAQQSARMKEVHSRPGESERRGALISKAHNTPEGKAKLARRRRRGESIEDWKMRIAEEES